MNSEVQLLYTCTLLKKLRQKQSVTYQRVLRRKILKLYFICTKTFNVESTRYDERFWVRPIFTVERRLHQGASNNLIIEMELRDHEKFFNFFRMTEDMFYELLDKVGPLIQKHDRVRSSIPAKKRLQICIRYLASGDSMLSLSYAFRVASNTISLIISETCEQIWLGLKHDVFPSLNEASWHKIADEFENSCNFPNCIGAIDGKHVIIQAPPNSGLTYYNYKGSHSINLMAVSDAKYKFICVDIGAEGRQSDGGVFHNSAIFQQLEDNDFHLPLPRKTYDGGPELPYVLLGDAAFPLKPYLMRPYSRVKNHNHMTQVFNYRLSRARRTVESAFGILVARWRIFRRPIIASVKNVCMTVQAVVCLHNFIMIHEENSTASRKQYSTLSVEEKSEISNGICNPQPIKTELAYMRKAANIRHSFAEHFISGGSIPWQWEKAMNNHF